MFKNIRYVGLLSLTIMAISSNVSFGDLLFRMADALNGIDKTCIDNSFIQCRNTYLRCIAPPYPQQADHNRCLSDFHYCTWYGICACDCAKAGPPSPSCLNGCSTLGDAMRPNFNPLPTIQNQD